MEKNDAARLSMQGQKFDVIVVGVGAMGAATCCYLAKNGVKVLGVDQFRTPHDEGSHGGESRIIRKAYFEHPDYVPLLHTAYDNWHWLEQESKSVVFHKTGLLYAGHSNHPLIGGIKHSATIHHLALDAVSREESASKFPAFEFPEDHEIMFEKDAGYLLPDLAISAYLQLAEQYGAQFLTDTKVLNWEKKGGMMVVHSDTGTFKADKLIITAGPWLGQLLPDFHTRLRVSLQQLCWVVPTKPELFNAENMPCWVIAHEQRPGVFYGFPSLDKGKGGVFKLAYHFPAETVHPDGNRVIANPDSTILLEILDTYFPGSSYHIQEVKTCLYTNTPDEHFIIDFLPDHEKSIIIAGGFSGHGFKFASAIGEILSDLAIYGTTEHPIDLFKLSRFH